MINFLRSEAIRSFGFHVRICHLRNLERGKLRFYQLCSSATKTNLGNSNFTTASKASNTNIRDFATFASKSDVRNLRHLGSLDTTATEADRWDLRYLGDFDATAAEADLRYFGNLDTTAAEANRWDLRYLGDCDTAAAEADLRYLGNLDVTATEAD